MAADIFPSYCCADREVVWDLAARLRAEGAEAWIDQEGIGAATQCNVEIVRRQKGALHEPDNHRHSNP